MIFLNQPIYIARIAQMRHYLCKTLVGATVDGYKSYKQVARIYSLTVKVEVSFICLFTAADKKRGIANLACVDKVCCTRSDSQASDIGQCKMQCEEHQESNIVIAVGADIVVKQKGKKDDYYTYQRRPESHLQLL